MLVQTFRTLFHPIVELPLSLIGVQLSDPIKDGVLIWMAIGGAVGRTLTALYATKAPDRQFYVATNVGRVVNYFAKTPLHRGLLTLASTAIWPVLLFFGFRWPVVVSNGEITTILRSRGKAPRTAVVCDLRAIFLIHLVTITVAIVALVALSTVRT